MKTRTSIRVGALTLLMAFGSTTITPSLAQAQTEDDGRFDRLVQAALSKYKSGAFLDAVEDFEAAYALRPRPELVYNMARSYEKALRPTEAIEAYERFVELPGTTAALRTKALQALTALRNERAARTAAEEASRPPPVEALPRSGPTGRAQGSVAEAQLQSRNRTLELALMGTGVVIAGTGAVFGVLALDSESQWKDARASGQPTEAVNDLIDETRTNALVADILVGAGAVAAVSGLIVFLANPDEEPVVSVGPKVTEDGGGLVIGGRF